MTIIAAPDAKHVTRSAESERPGKDGVPIHIVDPDLALPGHRTVGRDAGPVLEVLFAEREEQSSTCRVDRTDGTGRDEHVSSRKPVSGTDDEVANTPVSIVDIRRPNPSHTTIG